MSLRTTEVHMQRKCLNKTTNPLRLFVGYHSEGAYTPRFKGCIVHHDPPCTASTFSYFL